MQGEHRWWKWGIYGALAAFGVASFAVAAILVAGSSPSPAAVARTSCLPPPPAAPNVGDEEHTQAFSRDAPSGPCAHGERGAAATRRLNTRRAWLASKSARQQRLASRAAFHALSPSASERLVRADFGSRIQGANPAKAVARAGKLLHYLGDDRAVVRTPTGRTKVITSSMPLRSANHGGPKRPIDLALHAARGSFAPANPLVSTSIARRLGGGATVGSPQLKVIPLGDDVEGTSSADRVFFHGIGTDEDAAVTPTLTGVELSTQLRSPQSPEQIGYRLVPPAGARLVAHGTGARVEQAGGRVLATVSTPSAIDAQGTPVPVRMSVRGSQLLLEVDHRSREVAYPVLVDPRVVFPVKKSSPGWDFHTCAPDCGEGYSGQEMEGPEPGVITAPVGYYGYGVFSKEDESVNEFCDEFFELVPGAFSCSPFMHKEPEVDPYGIWQWPDENAVGESRVVKTTYEGISITPGVWVETSRGTGGTGYMGYSVGCYESNNLTEESPPATVESCSEHPFPRVALGFLQRPYEEVWTGSPISVAGWPSEGTFGFREGEVSDATTLSVEAYVVEEERKPHRRHGPRKRELLGPNSPGNPKLPRSCKGDPVDCVTGNLTETQTDIDVPGLGVGLTLARTYNSQPPPQTPGMGRSATAGAGLSARIC